MLDFDRTYILSARNLDVPPRIVLGVRPGKLAPVVQGGPTPPTLMMLVAGSDTGYQIQVAHTAPYASDGLRVIDGRLTVPEAPDAPVQWEFRPLTLERLKEFHKRSRVSGYDELVAAIHTDADLQNFYHHEFLFPYWKGQWEREKAQYAGASGEAD